MFFINGDGGANRAVDKIILQAKKDIPDREERDSIGFFNEEHLEMGDRQVEICIWCQRRI